MPNRLPFAAAMLVAACLTTAACTQLRQLKRFFLTRCPEDGPHREQEFDIHLEPVDVDRYYHDLSTAAAGMAARPVTNVDYKGETYAVHDVGPIGAEGATSIVVLAGVHGNEIAGALAAPAILQDVRSRRDDYRGVRIHVVAPVNPVGLRYGSRYNADGCDINRDFREFGTAEARVIRDVLMEAKPHLILSLHEGPHDGFFVIATRSMPEEVARAAAASIPADVMPLATENNFGWTLGTPGVMREGWFVTGAKTLFRIDSLGAYGEERGVPVLTTEGPWSSRDVSARVQAQVLAVRGVARYFTQGEPSRP